MKKKTNETNLSIRYDGMNNSRNTNEQSHSEDAAK